MDLVVNKVSILQYKNIYLYTPTPDLHISLISGYWGPISRRKRLVRVFSKLSGIRFERAIEIAPGFLYHVSCQLFLSIGKIILVN